MNRDESRGVLHGHAGNRDHGAVIHVRQPFATTGLVLDDGVLAACACDDQVIRDIFVVGPSVVNTCRQDNCILAWVMVGFLQRSTQRALRIAPHRVAVVANTVAGIRIGNVLVLRAIGIDSERGARLRSRVRGIDIIRQRGWWIPRNWRYQMSRFKCATIAASAHRSVEPAGRWQDRWPPRHHQWPGCRGARHG